MCGGRIAPCCWRCRYFWRIGSGSPAQPTGARYAAAVEAHAACDDGALAWVASLDEKALAAEASAGGVAAWSQATVASAIVLHARIAASLWRAGAAGWRAHLEHARRLAARLDPRPAVHGWLAAWFSLAASQYLAAGDARQAGELLDAVPRPLRREPLILLARGALHEYLATDRLAPAERSRIDGASPLNSPSAVADGQRRHLERAARVDPAQLGAALGDARAAGSTALFDAVVAGLLGNDNPGRRSLVLVYSDGVDTASWLQADDALDIAARSEAVVYAIAAASRSSPWSRRLPGANLQTGPYRGDFPPLTSRAQIMGASAPGHLQFLQDLAERSGGRLLLADAGDLERAFREIADEFRQRYVLSYSPEGVERRGWHQLDLRLTRRQGQVKARRGYFGS